MDYEEADLIDEHIRSIFRLLLSSNFRPKLMKKAYNLVFTGLYSTFQLSDTEKTFTLMYDLVGGAELVSESDGLDLEGYKLLEKYIRKIIPKLEQHEAKKTQRRQEKLRKQQVKVLRCMKKYLEENK